MQQAVEAPTSGAPVAHPPPSHQPPNYVTGPKQEVLALLQRLQRRKIVSPPGRCRLRQSCILPIPTDVTGRATSSLHPESSFKRLPIDLPSFKKLKNPLTNLLPPSTSRSSQLQPPQWSSLISCEFVAQSTWDSRSCLGQSCLVANMCLAVALSTWSSRPSPSLEAWLTSFRSACTSQAP